MPEYKIKQESIERKPDVQKAYTAGYEQGVFDTMMNMKYGNSSEEEAALETLDEYICSLPLEERAEKFILHFEGYGMLPYYSAITKCGYLYHHVALQATIEALKSPMLLIRR